MELKDLSQSFRNGMPHAITIPAPSFRPITSVAEHGLRVTQLAFASHIGTHLDAPAHFVPDGLTIDELPLELLHGPAVAVSVVKAGGEPITAAELEAATPPTQPGDALLIRTGWGAKFWDHDYDHHPYLADDAARWIVARRFRLVGLDIVTPDLPGPLRPPGFGFPVHHILLGNRVLIIENLYLEEVIGRRMQLFVGALKIADGDGAPARVLAVLNP
ncbi:MAG: cyclase family protein [Chloroflexi bacterium OHK40]